MNNNINYKNKYLKYKKKYLDYQKKLMIGGSSFPEKKSDDLIKSIL